MKEYLEFVGRQIKNFRIKKGLTQEELAQQVGYTSRSTINKIEKGLIDITQTKILQISQVLDVDPLFLNGYVQTHIWDLKAKSNFYCGFRFHIYKHTEGPGYIFTYIQANESMGMLLLEEKDLREMIDIIQKALK